MSEAEVMDDECIVLLYYDEDEHPFVLVSDAPDAATTVGARFTRSFPYRRNHGWPDDAQAYAKQLSERNGNAPINHEWFDCPFDFED